MTISATHLRLGDGLENDGGNLKKSAPQITQVSNASATSVAGNDSEVPIVFDTEALDEGGLWTSGSQLVAQADCVVMAAVSLDYTNNGTGKRDVYFKRSDGELFGQTRQQGSASSSGSFSIASVFKLSAGQSFQVVAKQNSGSSLNFYAKLEVAKI